MSKSDKQIDENEVTTVTPAKADETSNPGLQDAKPNDPPVRTNRPDVPIAASLAAGAGAHEGRNPEDFREVTLPDGSKVEVDANGIDRDGRFHAGAVK